MSRGCAALCLFSQGSSDTRWRISCGAAVGEGGLVSCKWEHGGWTRRSGRWTPPSDSAPFQSFSSHLCFPHSAPQTLSLGFAPSSASPSPPPLHPVSPDWVSLLLFRSQVNKGKGKGRQVTQCSFFPHFKASMPPGNPARWPTPSFPRRSLPFRTGPGACRKGFPASPGSRRLALGRRLFTKRSALVLQARHLPACAGKCFLTSNPTSATAFYTNFP